MAWVQKTRQNIRNLVPVKKLTSLVTGMSQQALDTGKTRVLSTNEVFNLNGRLLRVLPDQVDRNLLLKRLGSYLTSRRRGKLRLPKYFPQEVRRLSELPKRYLRTFVYWVKPNTSIEQRLPKRVFGHISRNFPGMIWNGPSETLNHMANVVGTLRLRKTDWPGISRYRWPSTPSFSEMLVMSRRGFITHGLDRTCYTVRNCMTRKALSDDIRLATKVVAYNIVGIRSSVEIEEKWLPWFRYSSGILFLTVRHNLPAGLVRSLLSIWKRNPFNLWLKENCLLKNFLRRHTPTDVSCVRDVVCSGSEESSENGSPPPSPYYGCLGPRVPVPEPLGMGSPNSPIAIAPVTAELLEEMGEEFAELFARLPN